MKRKTFVALLAVLMGCMWAERASAQIEFMNYKECSLNDVLNRAKAEKKCVFVDIWTPWCGVCKIIDRYVFTRKDVGEYFNKNFINLTFDAENAKWIRTAQGFNATAFPTMLILNPEGEVVMNIDNLGVPSEDDKTAEKSVVADRLMSQAGMALKLMTMSDAEFSSPANVKTMVRLSPAFDTKVFKRLIELKDSLRKNSPEEFTRIVDDALGSAAANMVSKSGHKVNTHKAAQYRAIVNALNMTEKPEQLMNLDLNIALSTGKWSEALTLAKKNPQAMKPVFYGMIMENLAGSCEDKAVLREALKVCGPAVTSGTVQGRIDEYIKGAYNELKAKAK